MSFTSPGCLQTHQSPDWFEIAPGSVSKLSGSFTFADRFRLKTKVLIKEVYRALPFSFIPFFFIDRERSTLV